MIYRYKMRRKNQWISPKQIANPRNRVLASAAQLILEMINPLHLPVRSCHQSRYSTLSGALSNQLAHPSPSVKHLPQPAYSPSCKFQNTTSRLGSLQPTITFDYLTNNHGKPGVKMHHLASPDCTQTVAGGNEKIMFNNGQRMTFRILVSIYRPPSYFQCF